MPYPFVVIAQQIFLEEVYIGLYRAGISCSEKVSVNYPTPAEAGVFCASRRKRLKMSKTPVFDRFHHRYLSNSSLFRKVFTQSVTSSKP